MQCFIDKKNIFKSIRVMPVKKEKKLKHIYYKTGWG